MGRKMSSVNGSKQGINHAEISEAEKFRKMFETFDWTQYT